MWSLGGGRIDRSLENYAVSSLSLLGLASQVPARLASRRDLKVCDVDIYIRLREGW